jgi:hypothetical protein
VSAQPKARSVHAPDDAFNVAQRLVNDEVAFRERLRGELASLGGVLRCRVCGAEQPIDDLHNQLDFSAVVVVGWPTCCGYTMRWITARQLADGVP